MTPDVTLQDALARRRSRRDFATRPVPLECVQRLIWAAQGVTGDDRGRTAPSAHALHPLRLRLLAGSVGELKPGLYEGGGEDQLPKLLQSGDCRPALQAAALEEQPWVSRAAAVLAFYADMDAVCRHFAEQPPQGERGRRYVYVEAGAAAQNALLQATAEGLGGVLVAGFLDTATAEALGLEPPFIALLYLCFGWPAPETS